MKPTMTMMVGLAASGKSTYAKKIVNDTDAIILSSDAIRWELFGDETDQEHNQQVFQELHKRAKNGLSLVEAWCMMLQISTLSAGVLF